MSVEKLRKDGKVIAYRSNVYYKGRRYIGKRRTTKKEAELDEAENKRMLLTGTYKEESKVTIQEAFDNYMSLIAPNKLSTNSINTTNSLYNNHIEPAFGFREMNGIKSIEIQRFLVKKEEKIAKSTIIKLHTILNQIYKSMISWGEIKDNPLDGVQKPAPNYKKVNVWTKEECHKFLGIAKGYQSYIAYWIALQFGLRLSEVQGLRWKNIDFKDKLLYVEQAYHEKEKKLGGLKTKSSYRVLPISDVQADVLTQHKKAQQPHSDIVAANINGGYLMQRNIRRAMKRISKRAKVQEITFHELRHTHATLFLELNEHTKVVQQRLGHAKSDITIDTYSHVRPQIHRESAERFSDFFGV